MSTPAACGQREARAMGRGGLSRVAEATGLSRVTIRAGLQELACADPASGLQAPPERVRRRGGGRKSLSLHDPHLLHTLETLVDWSPVGTRCPFYDGHAKVQPSWRPPCGRKGIR